LGETAVGDPRSASDGIPADTFDRAHVKIRHVGFYVQQRRAIKHVQIRHAQRGSGHAQKPHTRNADGINPWINVSLFMLFLI
jgi:hypothetical protein